MIIIVFYQQIFYYAEFGFRERKYELNKIGEKLFAMPESKYATLTKTRKDLSLLTQLYDLYAQVLETAEGWNNVSWAEFGTQKETMLEKVDGYDSRCELFRVLMCSRP